MFIPSIIHVTLAALFDQSKCMVRQKTSCVLSFTSSGAIINHALGLTTGLTRLFQTRTTLCFLLPSHSSTTQTTKDVGTTLGTTKPLFFLLESTTTIFLLLSCLPHEQHQSFYKALDPAIMRTANRLMISSLISLYLLAMQKHILVSLHYQKF